MLLPPKEFIALSTVEEKKSIIMSGEYKTVSEDCSQRPKANELDNTIVKEEIYKNTVLTLKKEYNFDMETRDDYAEKFQVWLNAYPVVKKNAIINEHEHDWSVIYKNFHKIFRADVWDEYRDKMWWFNKVKAYGHKWVKQG